MTEFKLGRIIEHDARSLDFPAAKAAKLVDVDHTRYGSIFDQGNVGACVGNAIAGALMTAPLWNGQWAFTEKDALAIYSAATKLDNAPGSYLPDDTGTSGLAGCKAAKKLGYITAYHHAFGLQHALEALVVQPVVIGVGWYDSFFKPLKSGELVISPDAQVAGGHEIEMNKLVVKDSQAWIVNSWGDWGLKGHAWFSFDTLDRLLHEQGDCTVPVR
jgi:hypothetical protein